MFMWTDAIERGLKRRRCVMVRGKDKLDVPIKMIWNYAGNCLINQHSEINRTHEILQDDEVSGADCGYRLPHDLIGEIC